MHRRSFLRFTLVAMLAAFVMPGSAGGAQTATDPDVRAALAAITLTGSELPSDYTLLGEAFVGPEGGPAGDDVPAEYADSGYLGSYMSIYETADSSAGISSYASAWSDPSAAEAAFGLLEDAQEESDEPLDAGDGAAELTVTDDGFDATFVVDRYVVGVTVAGGAIERDGVESLVGSLEQRASAVVSGEYPAGTDATIPGSVLDTRSLGSEIRAGYLSASESEQLYGLTGSSLGGMQASWVSLVATGADATAPFVAIAVSGFESPDNAARVVEQAEQLMPLTVDLQPIDGVTVDGADSARGFQYASAAAGDTPDSARIVVQVGAQVAVVDIQGAGSADEARTAAVSLANAQVACLGGTCVLPDVSLGGQ